MSENLKNTPAEGAEQAAGASADSEGDAAVWADAAAESAEQAFGSAQCAWRAAWQASVARSGGCQVPVMRN